MSEWTRIAKLTGLIEANVVLAALHAENIDTQFISKKDSAYVFLGYYEIFVLEADQDRAKTILEDIDDRELEANVDNNE